MTRRILRQTIVLIAALSLLACSGEADFSGQLQTETLSAEEYQTEIQAIDRLLFAEAPLGERGVEALRKELEHLADRVRAHDSSRFLTLESLELRRLALVAGRLPIGGSGGPLQNDWMRIRSNLFDDRAWFARSARDLTETIVGAPSPSPQAAASVLTVSEETRDDDAVRATLTGRWQATSILTNGSPSGDAELSNSIWTFAPPHLTIRSPDGKETTWNFNTEGDYLSVMNASGEDGWMRFELVNGSLRIALNDGLQGKPRGFEAQPDQKDPMLIVVTLSPIK